MQTLFRNDVLVCSFVSWLIAQVAKVLINWRLKHTLDWRRMFGMGGMPSSHTASLVALTVMVGAREGLDSTLFAIAFAFTSVVVYDAMGVRYQTGEQSKVINRILHEMLIEGKRLTEEKMQELVGHTPLEVIFGALIGLVTPIFFI